MIRLSVEAAKVVVGQYIFEIEEAVEDKLGCGYWLTYFTWVRSLTASSLKFGLCLYFMAGLVSNFPEQQQQAKYTTCWAVWQVRIIGKINMFLQLIKIELEI